MTALIDHSTFALIILGGFVAGLIHVLSGPDHLAAIASLAIPKQSGAWLTGRRWRGDDASAVVGLGGILLLHLISDWSDRIV